MTTTDVSGRALKRRRFDKGMEFDCRFLPSMNENTSLELLDVSQVPLAVCPTQLGNHGYVVHSHKKPREGGRRRQAKHLHKSMHSN